ncbi:MAG: rhomboid family intramembrane serine protease [Candidatus Nanoarchaeia archaeon]|nr:rhomboid family intramembrane serine protease [Candidatus Haiyanarchaeum thermophilum]MCW1302991.1 rhomboid family intramembrane serine protease [Candidatus Haiyanarchaeum thermophilum]MCW1303669.1 rhomboid family intramembrane serine protease [Candidatus Haiyanarchaeum thermophilum]MCW1306349.1 rhomboid family intramembrane serine protease [Candidatus Haiyanarchaeum thermophilum]MCW1307141.1 rhomboid family intramembrane serine protease [Candidatus Haiyanarchaeum thermophilum]
MKAQLFLPFYDTADRFLRKIPVITITLVFLNVIIFLISLFDFEKIIMTFGFIPAKFDLVTLFTSMFLHGGVDHLFGNMWYLLVFGDNVEEKLGRISFLWLYFTSGICAAFIQYITDPFSEIPIIGASGAISGILGAYLVFFPREKVLVRIGFNFIYLPTYVMLSCWFLIQFIFGAISLLGFMGSNIAFWAHIGGFIFGILAAFLINSRSKSKRRKL